MGISKKTLETYAPAEIYVRDGKPKKDLSHKEKKTHMVKNT